MSQTTAPPAETGRFEIIPIDELAPSPLNPRKHFDKDALTELAGSIAAHGIVTPILVRKTESLRKPYYEIAAGERRHRAAKQAGLDRVPVVIREMDDIVFLETMTIENLQREDLHPLEEADGYRELRSWPETSKTPLALL
jgi:ParB family chromosome partitioning protein